MTAISVSRGCITTIDQTFDAASQLRFPWRVHEAAVRYIHTFLHRQPQSDDQAITACAALFLASKTEEAPRKLSDIIQAHHTIKRSKPHHSTNSRADRRSLMSTPTLTSTPSSVGQTNPAIEQIKTSPLKSSPIIVPSNLSNQPSSNPLDLLSRVSANPSEPDSLRATGDDEELPEVFMFNSDALSTSPVAPRHVEEEARRSDNTSQEEEAIKVRVCSRESEILLAADFAFGFIEITPIIIQLCAQLSIVPSHPSPAFTRIIRDSVKPASHRLLQQSMKVFKLSLKAPICISYTPQCIALACISIAAASLGMDLMSIVQQTWKKDVSVKFWFQILFPNFEPVISCWKSICSINDGTDMHCTLGSTLSLIDRAVAGKPSSLIPDLADCWQVRSSFEQLLTERVHELQAEEESAKRKEDEAAAKRKAEEAAAKRKIEEATAKRRAEETAAKRQAEEAAAKRRAEEAAAKRQAEIEHALRYPPPPPPKSQPPPPLKIQQQPVRTQAPIITITPRSVSLAKNSQPPYPRPPTHVIHAPVARPRLPPPIFDSYQPPSHHSSQPPSHRSSPPPPPQRSAPPSHMMPSPPHYDERNYPYEHNRRPPISIPLPSSAQSPAQSKPQPQQPPTPRLVVTKRDRERMAQARSRSRSPSPPPKRSRTSDSRSPSRDSSRSRSRHERHSRSERDRHDHDYPRSRSRERYDRYEDERYDDRHDRRSLSERDRDRHHRERDAHRSARRKH